VYQLFYIGIDIILFLFFGIISTLMGYGFFYRRRIASLKFNLMVVQTVIEEIENGQSE
jgi:predicted CDP-diglyceride synthetase/phosphatidate cytidylyltransferase